MKPILTSLFVLLFFASPTLAEPNNAVRLSDINAMLKQGKEVDQILVVMSERGVGFRVTPSAERKLKAWAFTEEDIESVRDIIAGKKYVPKAEREIIKDDVDNGAHNAGDQDAFPIGHGPDDHELMKKVLSRAVDAAKLDYRTHKLARATLHCSDRMSGQALPLLIAVEKKLVADFPACLSNATHPNATLFVIADNEKDFKRICKIIALSYEKQWPGFTEGLELDDVTFWVLCNVIVIDGDAIQGNDQLQRHLAFGMGFMVIEQISDEEGPEGLSTGFGNVLEKRVAGTPTITLSADSGEEDDEINNWAMYVRDQLAARRLDSIDKVCLYTVERMHNRHYAIAWSLAEDLVKDSAALYNFLDKAADDADTPRTQLLSKAYGIDPKAMHQRWAKTIADK